MISDDGHNSQDILGPGVTLHLLLFRVIYDHVLPAPSPCRHACFLLILFLCPFNAYFYYPEELSAHRVIVHHVIVHRISVNSFIGKSLINFKARLRQQNKEIVL